MSDPEFRNIGKDNPEYKLHVAIINHLHGKKRVGRETIKILPAFKELFVTHMFSGRSKEDGFFLQQMGVVPGVADLLCIWKNGMGFLEIKSKTGTLSTPQKRFKWFCERFNLKWAIVRSVSEAHIQLRAWGCEEQHTAIIEPDIRNDAQKKTDAFNFYKRPTES